MIYSIQCKPWTRKRWWNNYRRGQAKKNY